MNNNATGKNIEALRQSLGLTQTEFGDKLGVTRTTVYKWERGDAIRGSSVQAICKAFNVTEKDVRGFSDGFYAKIHGLQSLVKLAEATNSSAPVAGIIAAGDPREAFELTGESLWIPPEILERDPDTFYLLVGSDSLDETDYKPGVYAAISPNAEVKSGDIAAVKVNGDDATLKVVKFYDDFIALEPRSTNPDYKRIIIDERDPDAPYFGILGKAIWPFIPIKF